MQRSIEFERALEFVLKWEGGYVNDPADPGGETKYGISKRSYPGLDIRGLTRDEAGDIYWTDYWLRAGCEGLEWPLSLVVFDTSVNMGVRRAEVFMKKAGDWRDLVMLRVEFYARLARRSPGYLRGWINRAVDLYRRAWADGAVRSGKG